MQIPDRPPDEEYRLQALHGLGLDNGPEPGFDDIVAIGRAMFGVPTCLVSIVDDDRQWFKAKTGLDGEETPRDVSFCGHAILKHEVMVVPDARQDPRFHDNPLVTGDPFIRFYAGAPIRLPNGYTIGTVCVLGPETRPDFGDTQVRLLAGLANLALEVIGVRALRRAMDDERHRSAMLRGALEHVGRALAIVDPDGNLLVANATFETVCTAYPAPGESLFAMTSLTPEDLDPAGFDAAGMRPVTLRVDPPATAILHHGPDGYVIVGLAEDG